MSTLRVNTLQNTATTDGGISIDSSGHVTVDDLQMPSSGPLSNRNKIINGDMRIDQRNAGASVTLSNTGSGQYIVDRWRGYEDTDGGMTAQRSSTAPDGFTNSILLTVTSADTSLGATQRVMLTQVVEGYNIADLDWGTANAKSVTLSFWVRSSVTGTFGGSVKNSGATRSYPYTYTISSANTWERKTVTIPGDTSGTWNTDNTMGLSISFSMGAGSTFSGTANSWQGSDLQAPTGAVSLIGTNGATWYVTGVQLEVGSVATPFENRPIGTELGLCLRYYETGSTVLNAFYNSGNFGGGITVHTFKVTMRVAPTIGLTVTAGSGAVNSFSTSINTRSVKIWWNGGASEGDYKDLTYTANAEL